MGRPRTEMATHEPVTIRLPHETLETCRQVAKAEYRSLNAQLLLIVEAWMKERAKVAQASPTPS